MLISVEDGFPKLYKYAKKEHVRGMLKEGRFRIGTMYSYRKSENPQIRDGEEGRKAWTFEGPTIDSDVQSFLKSRPDLAENFDFARLRQSVKDRVPVALIEDSPDTYLFCTTYTFDEKVMREFGYDACIEILDPRRFLFALNNTMCKHAYLSGLRRCHYVNRWAP